MRITKYIVAAAVAAGTFLTAAVVTAPAARAQSTTTGAIQGIVKDKDSGEPLPGITVVATSRATHVASSGLTDENGYYKIDSLAPGVYDMVFYFSTVNLNVEGVNVGVNKTTPVYRSFDTNAAFEKGEVIKVHGSGPTIDPTSTTQGITLDQEYTKNIPVPGRTFDAALGAAAGSQNDGLGVSFSGSSSLENQYYVDGVNTTGLSYGTVGSAVLNDFIQEIEVITGGYNAEYGRATGGVVNVVTKSGSNELQGSVFGYITPGALVAQTERSPSEATMIEAKADLAYRGDFGFDLGGPIIKDKVWYYVGFAPTFSKYDYTRTVLSHTDCRLVLADGSLSGCMRSNADGNADRDPNTGFYITDELDKRTVPSTARAYQILGKLNFAVTPEHQGQISAIIQPGSGRTAGIYGTPQSTTYEYSGTTADISGKWTSKFNDNKTEVEGVLGYHRSTYYVDLAEPTLNDKPFQDVIFGNMGTLSGFGAESDFVKSRCFDDVDPASTKDPYPLITNCPDNGVGYSIGGAGSLTNDIEQRMSGKVSVTQRLKALGSHEIKGGIDAENNMLSKSRLYSGGGAIQNFLGGTQDIRVYRWVQLAPPGTTDPRFDNMCRTPAASVSGMSGTQSYMCDYLAGTKGYPGTQIEGNTLNWAAYLRDSWQIRPNITLNYGLRYEEQRMRYAKGLRNTIDPLTLEHLGTNAMVLKGMFAPRLGLLYDWTKEGRSKIYGHWGRFYESVPMDINDRSFGGEVEYIQDFASNQCGNSNISQYIGGADGTGCVNDQTAVASLQEQLFGASGVLVAPGIKAQYLDEVILGVEYEIMDDLKIGISFQNRQLGRVIEDVSTDGAQTYIISNPGEISDSDLSSLEARIAQTDDMMEKTRLMNELRLFKGIRIFDKPRRDYNALQFTVTRRVSKNLYLQGSYTYSRTEGNYPGLISYDNGQVDPNISSQYDLIELLSNRDGPLPQDRPHYIKLDGYYTFDFKKAGQLTLGARIRALSGIPRNVLGGHYLYGRTESFILPRGQIGRTNFEHGIDLHVGYGRDMGHGTKLELFSDIFNLYNRQGQFYTDDVYGYQLSTNNVNPIVGGTYEDVVWARRIDQNGAETGQPLLRNKNFGNTTVRYSPLSVRFGMRLSF